MNIIEELQWRRLFADCTDTTELTKKILAGPVTLYCGFDPTADSLHVGHLVPLLALARFQRMGHNPIAVAGGATGSIGDPSGKSAERSLLTKEQIAANVESVKPQLERFLDFSHATHPARLVDNASWTANVSYLDFLREIGKHFTVNVMVAKESVRARMEDRDVGISYTEFSYMLLQSFDFYHLNKEFGCELQIGGSDQWGNITMGMDLTRKKAGQHVFGLTLPLITKSDGTKFGKTESGAIWLDPKRTSVYRFYQFWINVDDRDVIPYLKYFTFLEREEIAGLETAHKENPGAREAHRALATALTEMIHGEHAAIEAINASKILFGGTLDGIQESTFNEIVGEIPTKTMKSFGSERVSLLDVLVSSGLCQSKGQARKDVQGGGIYLNNIRENDFQRSLTADCLLFDRHLLLRKGKRNYAVVTIDTK